MIDDSKNKALVNSIKSGFTGVGQRNALAALSAPVPGRTHYLTDEDSIPERGSVDHEDGAGEPV
jgi:hypothetical protein